LDRNLHRNESHNGRNFIKLVEDNNKFYAVTVVYK
jgi:hypothetical protein